jgi:hypothetical protein
VLEESDCLAEIRLVSLEQTADVSRRRGDGVDAGVQLRSPPAGGERELRKRVVLCCTCDAREQHIVGDVERKPRQDRSAVRVGHCVQPSTCRFGVASCHREDREQPACVAPHRGRALIEHDPGQLSRRLRAQVRADPSAGAGEVKEPVRLVESMWARLTGWSRRSVRSGMTP